MTGESQDVLWPTLPSVLLIILLLRSSQATAMVKTVIGGVWARSCLNVKLDGLRSVLKMHMIPTERLSTGVNHYTSQTMSS